MSLSFRCEKISRLSAKLGSALTLDTSETLALMSCYNASTNTLFETTCPATQKPSESIIISIEACLKEAKLSLNDIHTMLIGLGPGSFTGLRVGLATMKGLALGAQVPLYGFCSLEALAQSHHAKIVVSIRNAQRGELFAGAFKKKNDALNCILPVGIYHPEALAMHLNTLQDCPVTLLGEAASLLKPYLKIPEQFVFTTQQMKTEEALLLKQDEIQKGQYLELEALSPAYLRLSAAEENIKRG